MSGGSWDYSYSKVSEMAEDLREGRESGSVGCFYHPNGEDASSQHPLKLRLADHLDQLSEILKAIEWSHSGDRAPDAWVKPCQDFLGSSELPSAGEDKRRRVRRLKNVQVFGTRIPATSVTDGFLSVLEVLHTRDPESFDKLSHLQGRKYPFVSKDSSNVGSQPEQISDSPYFVNVGYPSDTLWKRARLIMSELGYNSDDLLIEYHEPETQEPEDGSMVVSEAFLQNIREELREAGDALRRVTNINDTTDVTGMSLFERIVLSAACDAEARISEADEDIRRTIKHYVSPEERKSWGLTSL